MPGPITAAAAAAALRLFYDDSFARRALGIFGGGKRSFEDDFFGRRALEVCGFLWPTYKGRAGNDEDCYNEKGGRPMVARLFILFGNGARAAQARCQHNSQNAIALAAATLSESTPCAIGIYTV